VTGRHIFYVFWFLFIIVKFYCISMEASWKFCGWDSIAGVRTFICVVNCMVTNCLENLDMSVNVGKLQQSVSEMSYQRNMCASHFKVIIFMFGLLQYIVDYFKTKALSMFWRLCWLLSYREHFCRICTEINTMLIALIAAYTWTSSATFVETLQRVEEMAVEKWTFCIAFDSYSHQTVVQWR